MKNFILKILKKEGLRKKEILDALCDGAFLSERGWSQEEVEDAYNEIKKGK